MKDVEIEKRIIFFNDIARDGVTSIILCSVGP